MPTFHHVVGYAVLLLLCGMLFSGFTGHRPRHDTDDAPVSFSVDQPSTSGDEPPASRPSARQRRRREAPTVQQEPVGDEAAADEPTPTPVLPERPRARRTPETAAPSDDAPEAAPAPPEESPAAPRGSVAPLTLTLTRHQWSRRPSRRGADLRLTARRPFARVKTAPAAATFSGGDTAIPGRHRVPGRHRRRRVTTALCPGVT